MRLTHGGRSVITRESLSEFTSAIAMCRCDDKRLTRRLVSEAGITVPRARLATFDGDDYEFLREVGEVVVKPTRGEQGKGITVGVTVDNGPDELAAAVARAREQYPEVLIEQRVNRRRPAAGGDRRPGGRRRAADAARDHRHRRAQRAGFDRWRRADGARRPPEASPRIPLDEVTEATVVEAGWQLDDVLPQGNSAARSPHRQPASGRHDPRCHRRSESGAVSGRGGGGRGDRHPGDGHRPARPRRHRRGVRLHRSQRATGAGQPRTTAHRCGFRRLPVSRSARPAAGLDSRGIAA